MKNVIGNYTGKNHVISAILFVLALWFFYEIRGIVISFFIAYIIMAALFPAVDFLVRLKIPRTAAVLISYLSVLIVIVLLVLPLFPFFVSQMEQLFKSFPIYFHQAAQVLGIQVGLSDFTKYFTTEFSTISSNAFVITSRVLGGLFSVLAIFVVSLYMLFDRNRINDFIAGVFPSKEKASVTILKTEEKLGAWVRGQLFLSVIIGVITWIALTILGIPFALPLALIAGFLEIVPTLGPIISAVPAVIVAMTISPTMALVVVALYIVIQAMENHLLVPKIMEKAVGLHPLIIIGGVMIGANLLGVIGALLSIPFMSMIFLIYKSVFTKNL